MASLKRSNAMELFRFYQAAVVNTLFGFGLYAILIAFGMNLYSAQAIAFVSGVIFNYVVYSRHVFRTGESAKLRFAAAYALNYLINLGLLWLFKKFVHNDYVVGFAASIVASLINYFALKYLVFVTRKPA